MTGDPVAALADARVLILAGGLSYERDVSLRSGRRIADALGALDVHTELADVDASLLSNLAKDPPDAVVFALHGAPGEDGSLRGVLELLDVPYVGPSATSARRAWDKPGAKTLLREAGIATPDWLALPRETFSELGAGALLDRIAQQMGLPLVVKPAEGGSGLGVRRVTEAAELPGAMMAAFSYGDTALIETFVPGVDIAVSVVDFGDGPEALPAVEIAPKGVYDYAARYNAGATTWHAPARLSEDVAEHVADVAVRAHAALNMGDLSRIDLMVDGDGTPWVLEANVAPGMTETSLLPHAARAAGIGLGPLLARLVERQIKRR